MTLGDRIKKRRLHLNKTQDDIAKIVKTGKATIHKYENGMIANIPSDKIELLAQALRTTPGYLMGWEDDSFDIFSIPGIEPMPKMKKIPLLGTISCGKPILADENVEDYINVPEALSAQFVLRCKGDSMVNARIFDGDLVVIRQQETVDNGDIAAVRIDDEATLKRVYIFKDMIELRAENPTYASLRYYENDIENVHILGKAVFFISLVR